MSILVDVVDSQCSFRRRQLAIRASKHLLQSAERGSWQVRDFMGAGLWLDAAAAQAQRSDIHLVLLHASEGEADWRRIVLRLAECRRADATKHVRLLTYTGGMPPLRSYATAHAEAAEMLTPRETSWWEHCNRVFSLRDFQNANKNLPTQASAVGTQSDVPPVESWLEAALRGHPAPRPGRENAGEAADAIASRHTLVNIVGPLHEAIEFALGNKQAVAEFEALWKHLKAGLLGLRLPQSVEDSVERCERTVLPALDDAGLSQSALLEVRNLLRHIESYAESAAASPNAWSLVRAERAQLKMTGKLNVLWVEDDDAWHKALSPAFRDLGINVTHCTSVESLPDMDKIPMYDAAVVDIGLVGQGTVISELLQARGIQTPVTITDQNAGLGVLQLLQSASLPPPTYILSAYESPSVICACTTMGARGYFLKSHGDYVRLLMSLRVTAEQQVAMRQHAIRPANPDLIVAGTDDPLTSVLLKIDKITASESRGPILLTGEPGVGKGEIAKEIYRRSSRRNAPFIKFDCATASNELIGSDLFGHRRGAFTGAVADRKGALARADGGVLFIDELDKLDAEQQKRLLTVISDGIYTKMGDDTPIKVDVMLVFASNVAPGSAEGRELFSPPLLSRLTKFVFEIPPLRRRSAVVAALCKREAAKFPDKRLLPDAIEQLGRLARAGRFDGADGNIRGLQNTLERTLVLADEDEIGAKHLILATSQDVASTAAVSTSDGLMGALREPGCAVAECILKLGRGSLQEMKDVLEAHVLHNLILRADRPKTCSVLGITSTNLRSYIHKLKQKGFWRWAEHETE